MMIRAWAQELSSDEAMNYYLTTTLLPLSQPYLTYFSTHEACRAAPILGIPRKYHG